MIKTDVNSILTNQVKSNLLELAAYLKTYVIDGLLGDMQDAQTRFDLTEFYESDGDVDDYECGSTACAVGHFAIMRGYRVSEIGVYDEIAGWIDWRKFSTDSIGLCSENYHTPVWDWVFSGEWAGLDNTPLGVVARIEYLLDEGLPKGFCDTLLSKHKTGEPLVALYLPRREALELECGIR